jgi:leader peptidase (prepilin peptidase)/N-methyltransferase
MTAAAFARFLDAWVFAVGACVGSFLNVVIARVPGGRSIVSPPSSCPKCGKRIAWYDNFPIVSWLLLRAKCRNCGQPISARYPLVELLTALLWFALWRRFGASLETVGYAALASTLLALTFIDLDTWLLPHQITWPLLAVGLASPLWNPEVGWSDSAIGAAAGFAAFAAIALIGEKLLKKETMGWGDVWLLAGIGAWLGWAALLPVVLLSAVQGSVVGVALLLLGRGPAEIARAERGREENAAAGAVASAAKESAEAAAAQGAASAFVGVPVQPPPDDDWVPPPHALPYGPFLALGALEFLLARDAILRVFFAAAGKLAG